MYHVVRGYHTVFYPSSLKLFLLRHVFSEHMSFESSRGSIHQATFCTLEDFREYVMNMEEAATRLRCRTGTCAQGILGLNQLAPHQFTPLEL